MIKKDDLLVKLEEIDDIKLITNVFDDTDNIANESLLNFTRKNITQEVKAVLGLDIYKYSDYDDDKQPLIPFVFDLLLDSGFKYVKDAEKTLFADINIANNFISTGDGGFIIFPTPLHALVFNL
jgi:hypothetical protein